LKQNFTTKPTKIRFLMLRNFVAFVVYLLFQKFSLNS
jgi:hypothetical protein